MALVFAMTRENGMMALEIPNGAHLDMTPPLNTEQLDQYNITGDIKRMKELMSSMTPKEVRDLTINFGADPEDVPKKGKRDVLIARFIARFERTRKEFEAIRPSLLASSSASPAPDTGSGIGVVSLSEDMSNDEIMAEVRRQIPALAGASDDDIEHFLENASRVERADDGRMTTSPYNPLKPASSTAPPPTSTPPVPENPSVKAFTGQAYKLSGDVEAVVEEMSSKDFQGGMADFNKHHIKPDLEVRILPYENAPKDNYTADTSGRDFYEVGLTEKTTSTKGKAVIELECQKAKFKFIYNYTEQDKVKDVLELIELNTDIKMEQMVLFYRGGNSYCQNHEPLWATILKMGGNEFKLCVRALGGGKASKRVKKQVLAKPEKLKKAQSVAQKVADKEASALKCMADSNDALTTFYTLAEKDPADAFLKAIDKMSEADLGKAYDSIKGDSGGTTEQKLKAFSTHLFGAPLAEISDLYGITGGILETANLSVSLAYDWGVEKDCVSLSFLRVALKSKLDKRIGAREQAESSGATRAMDM